MTERKHQIGLMKDFKKNVQQFFKDYILIELPERIDCWVAGGALRDFYLYGYIKGGTDIDIFTSNQENFDKIVEEVQCYYNKQLESKYAITFTDKDDEEKVIQVIKKFADTPQECISQFDLTCCCAYVSQVGGEVSFDAANEFYDDNYNKNLRFVQLSENPTWTIGRVQKYKKKGYHILDNELLSMMNCYIEGKTNFDELIKTYNGLKLKSSY